MLKCSNMVDKRNLIIIEWSYSYFIEIIQQNPKPLWVLLGIYLKY